MVSLFPDLFLIVANYDTSLLEQGPTSSEQPFLKGYLSKYTNVARGYNTRWFVLKNGILSCECTIRSLHCNLSLNDA